jgi:hypothetical protein
LTFLRHQLDCVSVDYEALEELLNLETILGDKTTIREIKRLSYGTKIHLKKDAVTLEKFWNPKPLGHSEEDSFVERNNELLFESLESTRGHSRPKIVLMSAGHDSRRIGGAAKAIGLQVRFATQTTIGLGTDKNSIIAKMISDCLGVPLILEGLPSVERYYSDTLLRGYWLGYESFFHEWIIPLLRVLPRNSLLFDGIIGDIGTNAHWARLFPEQYDTDDIDKIARSICDKWMISPLSSKIGSPSLFERVREQIMSFPDCESRVDYFHLFNRSRRNISCLAQLYNLHGHTVCYPYIFHPLFIHTFSLSPLIRRKKYYQQICMARVNRELSEIPSTRDRLDSRYYFDCQAVKRDRALFFAGKTKFNRQTMELFPNFSVQMRIFRIAALLRSYKLVDRFGWSMFPISNINRYFEWMEDRAEPEFPVLQDTLRNVSSNSAD